MSHSKQLCAVVLVLAALILLIQSVSAEAFSIKAVANLAGVDLGDAAGCPFSYTFVVNVFDAASGFTLNDFVRQPDDSIRWCVGPSPSSFVLFGDFTLKQAIISQVQSR